MNEQAAQTALAPARVLVVEDNPTQAELARMLVEALGHEVRVCGTAQTGFEMACRWRPAAILLDIDLPDEDGFALMRRLDSEAIGSAVIVVTANASMEMAKDAIRAGAADYLVKPFRRDRLSQLLADSLTRPAITQAGAHPAAHHGAHPAPTPTSPRENEPGPRILIVDERSAESDRIASVLLKSGYAIRTAASAKATATSLQRWEPDLVLLADTIAEVTPAVLAALLRDANSSAQTVLQAGNPATAVPPGVFDVIGTPHDPQRLLTTLRTALRHSRRQRTRFHGFIGSSPEMQAVYTTIESVSASRASVFITGESGTGKELAAEAVHSAGPRHAGPFVPLNCASIPRDLLESEVFGHVRGAFTGATADRTGAARLADGGTLFLDEVAEMPADMQAKLLRFVQTGTFQPVGSGRTERVDVRFVCATNRDPMVEVQAGRFREDLFYRLHVVPLALPPLRHRGTDVIDIARHFLTSFSLEESRHFKGFTEAAETLLQACPWPGNVRQLQNVIRQAVVLHDGDTITSGMLPALAGTTTRALPPTDAQEPAIIPLAEMERRLIKAALKQTNDDVGKAAHLLQVNPSTIYRKLQSWRLAGEV